MKEKANFDHGGPSADFTGNEERARKQKKEQEKKEQEEARAADGLNLAGLNINALSPKVKYGVGIGLMVFCALIIYWFMSQLSKSEDKRTAGIKKSK